MLCKRLCQKRLSRPGRTDKHNIAFFNFNIVEIRHSIVGVDALVMIVYRDGKRAFGKILTDHKFIERIFDIERRQRPAETDLACVDRRHVVLDNVHGTRNAQIAYIHIGSGDDAVHFFRCASAKRTCNFIVLTRFLTHTLSMLICFFKQSMLIFFLRLARTLDKDIVDQSVFFRFRCGKIIIPIRIFSDLIERPPVCNARISLIFIFVFKISSAWILISDAVPCTPPHG